MEYTQHFDQFFVDEMDAILNYDAFLKHEVDIFIQHISQRKWQRQIKILDSVGSSHVLAVGLAQQGYKVYRANHPKRDVLPSPSLRLGEVVKPYSANGSEKFDVVIVAHNAISAYLTEDDLRQSLDQIIARLEKNGLLLITTRNYDELLNSRPKIDTPHVFTAGTKRYVQLAVWDWLCTDICTYKQSSYVIHQNGKQCILHADQSRHRAWRRAEINIALSKAGFTSIQYDTLDNGHVLICAMPI